LLEQLSMREEESFSSNFGWREKYRSFHFLVSNDCFRIFYFVNK